MPENRPIYKNQTLTPGGCIKLKKKMRPRTGVSIKSREPANNGVNKTDFLAIGDTQAFSYRKRRPSNLDHNCALPNAHFDFLPPNGTFTTYPPGPWRHGKCAFSGYVRYWSSKILGTLKYRNQLLLLILPLNLLLLSGRISSSSWFVMYEIPVDSYCLYH
jgi:hypothetical protein